MEGAELTGALIVIFVIGAGFGYYAGKIFFGI